jgi:hypothetical protein
MPTYRIDSQFSCPAPLASHDEQLVAQTIESAAVAQLRLASGVGRVPPVVADALAILRSWYTGQSLLIPVMLNPAVHTNEVWVGDAEGRGAAIITNIGE